MRLYNIRQLSAIEIPEAQRLLYKLYKEELNWSPALNNASGVRYEEERLRDDFENTAIWFGAYHKNVLVGCYRLIISDIELLRYATVPTDKHTVELTRMAVLKEYRGTSVLTLLGISSYWYALKHGCTRCYGPVRKKTAIKSVKYGWQDTGIRFKYDINDPEETILLVLPLSYISLLKYFLKYTLKFLKFW